MQNRHALYHNFSLQQAKRFLAHQDRANGLLSLFEKSYKAEMTPSDAASGASSKRRTNGYESENRVFLFCERTVSVEKNRFMLLGKIIWQRWTAHKWPQSAFLAHSEIASEKIWYRKNANLFDDQQGWSVELDKKASSATFSGNGLLTVCRRKAREKKFFSLQGGSVFLLATGKQMLFLRQEKDRMRKVIVSEMITLDGFFAGPDGEIDWHVVDEDFNERTLELFRSVDTLVFGRVTYELMAKYWPTEAAQTDDPLIAEKMNTLPKVVFSRTLEKAEWGEWRNVTVVKGNLEEEIAKLKQAPGKDLVICGSSEIVLVLARAGLIDDYLLYVTPVVLGSGIPLFQGMKERIKLQLVNVQHLRSGVVRLHYRSVNSR